MNHVELSKSLGQMLLVGFDGVRAPKEILAAISRGDVGGVIIFSRNIVNLPQLRDLNATLQGSAPSDHPLIIAVDQEGGRVQRIRQPLTLWPPMRDVAEIGDPIYTQSVGRAIGDDLCELGFNLDFAPVLDVVQSDENSVIGDRAFGSTSDAVIRHALAMMRGLQESGLVTCGKHFPGHGGAVSDSHEGLPVETRSEAELRGCDLLPFRAACENNVEMLMTAHVVYSALDPGTPATLSKRICTEILRDEMGFRGVLISDDLEMGAIAQNYAFEQAVRQTVTAGVDMVLVCRSQALYRSAFDELRRMVNDENGTYLSRIEQALGRIAYLKQRLRP